jgi:L-asparaginase/Glu-tRNA(Gln) amidotransferase subunit D
VGPRLLALRIEEVLQSSQIDGAVYVQGTNTIEETAYFLNLTVHSDKPVVVTGAQRPYNGLSSDAQMNLLDAIRLAGDLPARAE